jgi:restriction system protein
MAIPDYQSLMLPLLQQVSDNREYRYRDLIELLAERFKLSDNERNELLSSGQQSIFDNRVGWAKTYLKKAGLLDSPKRAVIQITQRGLEVLKTKPDSINVKFLRQFPEFIVFQAAKREHKGEIEKTSEQDEVHETPEETLENAYQNIRKALAEELLSKVHKLPPAFFERLVVELLVKMGYGGSIADAGNAIGKSGDEGIDGIIKEDKLGLDIIYIQAKRWQKDNIVRSIEIQQFAGALGQKGAKKGVFITTSSFTKNALKVEMKNDTKIVLIDGVQLAELMIDYNLGVTLQQSYDVKRLDNDYFGDE